MRRRGLGLSCVFLVGAAGTATAAGEPTGPFPADAVQDFEALTRSAPPELKSTGKSISYGTAVLLIEEKAVGGDELRPRPATRWRQD